MITHVEFRSSMFPPYEGEEETINPGCWGQRLVEFLGPKLENEGLVVGEAFAEDWGWILPVENEKFDLWIGAGHQYEPDDLFLCFIHPDKPFVRKWFKKIDTVEDVEVVKAALSKVLDEESEITNVEWWTREEFQKGAKNS